MRRRTTLVKPQQEEVDDYFLTAIKKKGFCHALKPSQLRQREAFTVEELQVKLDSYLFAYVETEQ